jgi:phosphatidylglycerophosphatase A
MSKIGRLLGTCFGLGYLTRAPGTVGTLLGVMVYWFGMRKLNLFIYLVVLIVLFTVGVLIARATIAMFGKEDPQPIIIDELVGYLVAMFAVLPSFINIVLAFVIFRFFDILKPPPIRYLHSKIKGGLGMMVDDLSSGIMTCCLLHIIDFTMRSL